MTHSVLDIYKLLSGRNCGDCGHITCLAFATAVIKEGVPLEKCTHLAAEAGVIASGLRRQQQAGIGKKRLKIENALEALHEKMDPLDLAALAAGLGATFGNEEGRDHLDLNYFGAPVRIFKNEVRFPPTADADPWDAVLLFNYVCFQGSAPLSGKWIAMQDLPNSVSKAADIRKLQNDLAIWTDGHLEQLLRNAGRLGGRPAAVETAADAAIEFHPLDKTPVLMIFYRSDQEEGFPAGVQFLFDSRITDYLDMEAVVFLVERLTKKLRMAPLNC